MSTDKKYELIKTDTVRLYDDVTGYRIRALRDIGDEVKAGDLGGYIQSEENLEQIGNAWVSGNARIYSDARVSGDAKLSYGARVPHNEAIVWFSNVGSACGTLTACLSQEDRLLVTRGCFNGTGEEFMKAVHEKHGTSKITHEYSLLIEVACSRLGVSLPANIEGEPQ